MLKAISETQFVELLEYGVSTHCKSYNSLPDCYLKEDVDNLVESLYLNYPFADTNTHHGFQQCTQIIEQELKKRKDWEQ